jgi:hypothetical protein
MALAQEGQQAWTQNRAEQAAGLVRVVPENLLARPPTASWPEYRQTLRAKNVRESTRASDRDLGTVCKLLANEIRVRTDVGAIVLGR